MRALVISNVRESNSMIISHHLAALKVTYYRCSNSMNFYWPGMLSKIDR
jgi:hypothetical protein